MKKLQLLSLVAGVALLAFPASASTVLDKAKELGANKYAGWTYGSKAGNRQVDCTQFLDHLLADVLGSRLQASDRTAFAKDVNISHGWSAAELKKKLNEPEKEPRLAGAVFALESRKLSTRVSDLKQAKPGDIIQYWMQRIDGSWYGHSAIISRVWSSRGQTRVAIYGAHESTNGVGENDFNGVGLNLNGSKRLICITRHKST